MSGQDSGFKASTYEYIFEALWPFDRLIIYSPVFLGRKLHKFGGKDATTGVGETFQTRWLRQKVETHVSSVLSTNF